MVHYAGAATFGNLAAERLISPVIAARPGEMERGTLRAISASIAEIESHTPVSSIPLLQIFMDSAFPSNERVDSLSSSDSGAQHLVQRERIVADYKHAQRAIAGAGAPFFRDISLQLGLVARDFASRNHHVTASVIVEGGDLASRVLPALERLIPTEASYLTRVIPPHIGHGVSRHFHSFPPEVQDREKEWEAQKDRVAASLLLSRLSEFLTHRTASSLELFLSRLSTAGTWIDWLIYDAVEPEERMLSEALASFKGLLRFGAEYERVYLSTVHGAELKSPSWFTVSRCDRAERVPTHVYPLYGAALSIAAARSPYVK